MNESDAGGSERDEDYPAVGLGETIREFMESVEPLPDGWPETWSFQSWGCAHYFHWDSWEGHYRCLRCKYTFEKPPRHLRTDNDSEATDGD